jgi:hypothetical protein
MTTITGTYGLQDLIAQNTSVSVVEFGLDALNQMVQARLAFLNASVSEQLGLFCEESVDSRRIWGSTQNFEMKELDEFGVAKTQKGSLGTEVAFPLRHFGVAVGNTKDWYFRATAAEFAKRVIGLESAYKKRVSDEMAFALFGKTNYTFKDYLVDNTSLSVKFALNADSSVIPAAPNGTAFVGSSHQHYTGTSGSTLAYTDIDTLISNVTEHGNTGVKLYIPQALVATLAGLASTKFVKLSYTGIIPASTATSTVEKMDVANVDPNNILVGFWDGIPVLTRYWVPTSMVLCLAENAYGQKPLVYRIEKIAALQGFRLAGNYNVHPLMAEEWEANFGIGAWNRSAYAVLDTAHQTSYTIPTLIR